MSAVDGQEWEKLITYGYNNMLQNSATTSVAMQ